MNIELLIAGIVVLIIVVGLVGWLVGVYNGLVMRRNDVDKAFANIDVLLKQRADQIPDLMRVVQAAMNHENALFTRLSDARTAYLNASSLTDKVDASNQLNTALKSVIAVAETRDVENRRVLAPLWRAGGFYAVVVGLIGVGIMAMTPEHFAQLHLPGPATYQQMAGLNPAYRFLAWLYRDNGFVIPFMAAFGFLLTMFVVLLALRLLLPKGMRLAVGRVLGAWMGLGMVIGGVVTLLLVVAQVDTMKVFLVWMMILLGTLVFSIFEQRKLGVAYKHFTKDAGAASFGDEDA